MNGAATLQGLVEKSVGGDTGSFRALVAEVESKLFSYLRSRTSSREDALDALQDVLIDLWQSLRKFEYRSDAGFYRFVFTIAKRKLYRLYRAPHLVSLDDIDDVADTTKVQDRGDTDALERAIHTLDSTARDIVTLKHWSGFSFGEIGALLSMKEEAVRVRHHRALAKMRTILKTHD